MLPGRRELLLALQAAFLAVEQHQHLIKSAIGQDQVRGAIAVEIADRQPRASTPREPLLGLESAIADSEEDRTYFLQSSRSGVGSIPGT